MNRFISVGIIALALLLNPGSVWSHANGNSKISLKILDPDSIEITVDVNGDDLMNVTDANLNFQKLTRDSIASYQAKAVNYMLSRITFNLDEHRLSGLSVLRWKKDGKGPEDFLDSANLLKSSHAITFGAHLTAPRKTLSVAVNMFPELGIEPFSEISVYWQDSLLLRKWVGLDKTLKVAVSTDSLETMLARTRGSATASLGGENLFFRFVTLGFTHILPKGMDHILFVLGLFFFSIVMRSLLMQITAFTIAHSITLGLSLLGVVALPSRVVEPLIALSISVVAIENIFFRNVRASRWLIVFGFGLVHGLGFAGALRELGLPPGRFWSTLAGFNLGVEFGQLAVVSLAFVLTRWFWHKEWYFRRITVPISAIIAAIGLYWAFRRISGL